MEVRMLEAAVLKELRLIARNYSFVRRSWHKWRHFNQKVILPPPKLIEFNHKHDRAIFAVVYRPQTKMLEGYPLPGLTKRLGIKRSYELFNSILDLWNALLKPGDKCLNRNNYIMFCEYLYHDILRATSDPETARRCAISDAAIDFGNEFRMVFCEFYDAMFEVLDNCTTGKTVNEYVDLAKAIQFALDDEAWPGFLTDPYEINATEHMKSSYYPWMKSLLKDSPEANIHSDEDEPVKFGQGSVSVSPEKKLSGSGPLVRRGEEADKISNLHKKIHDAYFCRSKSRSPLKSDRVHTERKQTNLRLKSLSRVHHDYSQKLNRIFSEKSMIRTKPLPDLVEKVYDEEPTLPEVYKKSLIYSKEV
jgi:hypothetical protein